ncbi:MAG: class F sortase [Dehalococcoidia bacterium]
MVIDSIGVDAPVETYGLDLNAIPEVPTGNDAAEVVAWYNFSAEPGMGDNAVFSGHVTWFGRAVFWDLKKLQLGDTITLRGEDGTELVYAVSDSFLVDPADPESVQVMKRMSEDVITLITCDGDFVDTGDPVFGGDYTSRRVIRASLISVITPYAPDSGPYGGPYSGG